MAAALDRISKHEKKKENGLWSADNSRAGNDRIAVHKESII